MRIFASLNKNDVGVWKVKGENKIEKMEDSPEHAFIFNDEVNDVKCPMNLDKQWYISLANRRLKGFGVE